MMVLDIDRLDLSELATALEDHSGFGTWWIDPRSGSIEERPEDLAGADEDAADDPAERGLRRIDPLSSRDSYADMEDFTERVRDRRTRDLLERAIAGRGAFRRFKDTLLEVPQLREAWFTFHDTRMKRRAIEWLAGAGLVDDAAAERAMARFVDPALAALRDHPIDPDGVAAAVAADLRRLYGARLRRVILFGSQARGDADEESDFDLAVVLDRVDSPWVELDRMDPVLWKHSLTDGIVVSAIVLSERDVAHPVAPAIVRALAEGRAVA